MTTLYIRDVDEATAAILKRRAAAEGRSLSAYVAGQLRQIAARPTNAEVAERLRRLDRQTGPSADDIVDAIRSSRR